MNQDNSQEDKKKSEKICVNKQQTSLNDTRLGLVTLDNTRKELICIEKKCEKNRIKYDYLSGKNVKRLMEEYIDNLNDKNYKKKLRQENKSLDINNNISPEAMKSSPPIPKTSSAVIGWRSSLHEYNLEICGPLYISPRHTIVSLTPDEIPHQRFIYLG